MTIAQEVEKFLKSRGTQATPKHIASELQKMMPQYTITSSSISRHLKKLTAEGKLICKDKSGIQNQPVWYEWNHNYKTGNQADGWTVTQYSGATSLGSYTHPFADNSLQEPVKSAPKSKFTVGSVWETKSGDRAKIRRLAADGLCFYARHSNGEHKHFSTGEGAYMHDRRFDLIAPWQYSVPEAPVQSELRERLNSYISTDCTGTIEPVLDSIITEIERLSAKVEAMQQPVAYASEGDGVWNIVKPKPEKAGKRYWINVWQFRDDKPDANLFLTEDAARDNVEDTTNPLWKFIGQHTGTYEVEK